MSLFNFRRIRSNAAAVALGASLSFPRNADAFNASGVAQAAAGMAASYFSGGLLGGGGMDMEDMMGFAIAFTDLLEEFDIESDTDGELKDMYDKVQALESKAQHFEGELKRTKYLADDLKKTKNLTDKIKRIREMIKTTKTIAGLMKAMPKGGERALKVQDVRINYMILDELMKISRTMYAEKLDQRVRKAKVEMLVAGLKGEERAHK